MSISTLWVFVFFCFTIYSPRIKKQLVQILVKTYEQNMERNNVDEYNNTAVKKKNWTQMGHEIYLGVFKRQNIMFNATKSYLISVPVELWFVVSGKTYEKQLF